MYNRTVKFLLLALFSITIISGCNRMRETGNQDVKELSSDDLLQANQFLAERDVELIKSYSERRNWNINFTGSGLAYQIFEADKSGLKVNPGNEVVLEFSLSLLDGTIVYSSESDGLKKFIVGRGGVEAGLEEGVLMMQKGDRARFILPPFLGHGLIGDSKKIPARAVLIYEVHLLDVK